MRRNDDHSPHRAVRQRRGVDRGRLAAVGADLQHEPAVADDRRYLKVLQLEVVGARLQRDAARAAEVAVLTCHGHDTTRYEPGATCGSGCGWRGVMIRAASVDSIGTWTRTAVVDDQRPVDVELRAVVGREHESVQHA